MCKRWNEFLILAKIFLLLDYTGSAILILAKHLLFSRNHFFCFQKWKFIGAPTQVEFTIFYLFIYLLFENFWKCVLLNDMDKSVCGKFFIVLQLKDIKENWKRLISTCFKKPGFPILHYNHRTKQNKKVFAHIFANMANDTKRIHAQNFRGKW